MSVLADLDSLELCGRPLEIAELVLAPAPGETTQPVGAHALRAEPLSEEGTPKGHLESRLDS